MGNLLNAELIYYILYSISGQGHLSRGHIRKRAFGGRAGKPLQHSNSSRSIGARDAVWRLEALNLGAYWERGASSTC